MDKKRIDYFDIVKGIGIILVVAGHLEYIKLDMRYFIIAFHIPLFFVITGLKFNVLSEDSRDYKKYVSSRFRYLMLPYIYFSIIYLLVIVIKMFTSGYSWTYLFENFYQSICMYGISVLWFLPAMFFSMILFCLIRKKLSLLWMSILLLSMTVAAYFINNGLNYLNLLYANNVFYYHLYFFLVMLTRVVFSTFYVYCGYLAGFLFKKININKIVELIIGIAMLVATYYLGQINGAVDMHFLVFNKWYIYLAASLLGAMGVIFIAHSIEKYSSFILLRLVEYFGKNSLIIMVTHMDLYVLYVAILIWRKISYISHYEQYDVLCVLIIITVLMAEIIIIEIVNRFFPWILGKRRSVFDTK